MNDTLSFNTHIKNHEHLIQPVVPHGLYGVIDLSVDNQELNASLEHSDLSFGDYLQQQYSLRNVDYLIGGYLENRMIYKRFDLFQNGPARTIHLGVDIWAPAGTSVFTPLDAVVHSFAFNDNPGDYGTTLILQHHLATEKFYTLYGHLASAALNHWEPGMLFKAGEQVALLGNYHENGNWPPHLHFQIIHDLNNYKGDYPGVCSRNEVIEFQRNCPDPMVLLQKSTHNSNLFPLS